MRGATLLVVPTMALLQKFQSTLPMRGATPFTGLSPGAVLFQSTLPMRGATSALPYLPHLRCISIHTPHAGSDDLSARLSAQTKNFNPHSPCGERPGSHGADRSQRRISIHTPHAGSDRLLFLFARFPSHFNPHSPCGERHADDYFTAEELLFQSTLPMRGATGNQIHGF